MGMTRLSALALGVAVTAFPAAIHAEPFKLNGEPSAALVIFSQKNDGGWSQALDEARAKVEAATGMTIEERSGFPDEADRHTLVVLQAEATREHRSRIEDPDIDATLRKRLRKGLSISDHELASALAARDELRDQFILSCLGESSVAVLPVMPIRTP